MFAAHCMKCEYVTYCSFIAVVLQVKP